MKHSTYYIATIIYTLLFGVSVSHAVTPLTFVDTPRASVASMFQDDKAVSFAQADLNYDGDDEVITRPISCDMAQDTCLYTIYAVRQNTPLNIGVIQARHIMVGGSQTYGIADILAFKNDLNDYDFDLYIWSPPRKTYILKEE